MSTHTRSRYRETQAEAVAGVPVTFFGERVGQTGHSRCCLLSSVSPLRIMLLACQLTGPLMRQCLSKAPIGVSLARRPRLMSTEPSYGKPGWMNLPEGQRRNEWGHIMDIATTSSTTSKEQGSPESIWEAWERRHVSTLPRPHTAYSGESFPMRVICPLT